MKKFEENKSIEKSLENIEKEITKLNDISGFKTSIDKFNKLKNEINICKKVVDDIKKNVEDNLELNMKFIENNDYENVNENVNEINEDNFQNVNKLNDNVNVINDSEEKIMSDEEYLNNLEILKILEKQIEESRYIEEQYECIKQAMLIMNDINKYLSLSKSEIIKIN